MSHHRINPVARLLGKRRRSGVAATATVAVVAALLAPVASGSAQAVVAPTGNGFTVTAGDLSFILKQIKISERHAATLSPGDPCGTLVAQLGDGIPDAQQIPDRLSSYGLRTTDGSCNNLFPGRETFAAADQVFPRLTRPKFRDADPDIFGGGPTSYANKNGNVTDSQPRVVSNLVVDQTATNPAAVEAAANPVRTQGNTGVYACGAAGAPAPPDCIPPGKTLFIPNVTTDVGLSPPFNSIFTFFGQFFDHGVDQTVKSGPSVFVPLHDDDPLVLGPDGVLGTADDLNPRLRFMVLTRAQNQPGPDGILGNADDVQNATNTDSPWVDQSQTYTSHSSHQVFLREYAMDPAGHPASTGRLLGGLPAGQTYQGSPDGQSGMATWASVKQQAASKLGLRLVDRDVTNVPMLATDPYGEFLAGPNGLPQYVTATGLVEGDLANPVPVPANARHFDTPFAADIAHNADPSPVDTDHNPSTPPVAPTPDADLTPSADFANQPAGTYDDELLNAHFCAGDGRVNENIALSAIHQIFHSEHDRLVGDMQGTLDANPTLLAAFQDVHPDSADPNVKTWTYGDRLFQAARFVTEMEYQHLVFEEFARKVQPAVRPFHVYHPDINPAIEAEFAHAVYRFGHSMLDDDVARLTPNATGKMTDNSVPLLNAFLNPPAFFQGLGGAALTPEKAAGQIFMGSSDQTGNELDEFVTETLRNNLLGLPLDLPTINMARAREAGVPPLNDVRRQIFAQTNDGQLTPYTSWSDFGQHLKHPASLVNFVAAYGTHPSITGKTTYLAKRAAARAIVDPLPGDTPPADAAAFMFGTDGTTAPGCDTATVPCRDWSSNANGVTVTGLDDVDLWVGGLAEITNLFGGLLGSTFNYVFQTQMESLQDGDRLYYLARTPGMNLRTQLEGNSFAEMIQRNTDDTNTLKADVFATADCKFQLANLAGTPAGFTQFGSTVADDPDTTDCDESKLLLRKPDGTIQYRQFNSVDPSGINGQSVYNGTAGTDRIFGGNDNDTFWGGDGRDWVEGNGGDDVTLGGNGDDIETDLAGADVQKGGPGADAMDGGIGDDIAMGGDGQDFINGGANDNETFAGPGDDFVIAGQGADAVFGDGGDDWIEGGSGQDLLQGDHGAPFFDDPAETAPGHDIMVGQVGENDYDAEGGDDIMSQNAAVDRNAGAGGWDWAIHQYDTVGADDDMEINNNLGPLPIQVVVNRDRWQETEANSGSDFADVIRGTNDVPAAIGGAGFTGCDALDQAGVDRISGLGALLPVLTGDLAPVVANSAAGSCPLSGPIWGQGNILLGGGGGDTITGRGGDDIIDGDRYLAVRISVRTNPADPASEIGSTDLMEHPYQSGNPNTLQQDVFNGTIHPSQLVAVREIKAAAPPAGALAPTDTAVFAGPRSNYTVDTTPDHTTVTQTGANVAGQKVSDGTDTLRNIEVLQFGDQTLDLRLTVPDAPAIGTATAGNAQATVRWSAPAGDGGTPITGYKVQEFSGGTLLDTITGISPTATSRVVPSLTNGTTYTFRVVAVNSVGDSLPSAASNAVTPATVPGAPVIGNATAGPLSATVRWTAPPSNGSAITSYQVVVRTGTTVVRTDTGIAATATSTVVGGLTAGTAYNFAVRAVNAVGDGPLSAASNAVTPTPPPDTTPPTVTSRSPAPGATGVARTTNVTVTFSERVTGVTGTTFRLRNTATNALIPATVTLSANGRTATLNPNGTLAALTQFTVTLTGGTAAIRDAAGNPLATSTWRFRTGR